MPRVLFIGSGRPWDGGAGFLVRQHLFLRALSDVTNQLHLAMFDLPPGGGSPPPFTATVSAMPRPTRLRPSRLARRWADWADPLPRSIRDHDPAPTRAAIAALRPESFDAVFAYRIDTAHFAGVLGHPRLILDIDDPEHVRWTRRFAVVPSLADRGSHRDTCKLRAFEHAAEARAALAFVCQSNDAIGWPVTPEVVPNTVDLPPLPDREAASSGSPVVLFVGQCRGTIRNPNVDGVRHFLADIWPAVRAAVPGAQFHVVGATDEPLRATIAQAPGAVARGFVADLAAEYAAAAVSIAPIRFGTGTRVKILEAFAHACPVMSTAVGAEGIEAVPGREIELAVEPVDFARRLVALLCDRPAAERIGQGGRAVAERVYDSAAQRLRVADRLTAFLREPTAFAPGRKAAG
jgi:glycosyltransferase involved in cell wall biosynthesis